MKTLLKILSAPLLALINACSPLGEPVDIEKSDNHYYNKNKNDIHYSPMGNWFEVENSPMNADVESFEVISRIFSKDKNRLYFHRSPVKADALDFETFYLKDGDDQQNTFFDKHHVYAFEEKYGNEDVFAEFLIVQDANPKTYVNLSDNFSKDDKNYFHQNRKIKVDYDSFEILNAYFSRDKDSVYYHSYSHDFESIPSADLNSFNISSNAHIATDDSHVFCVDNEKKNIQRIVKKKEDTVALLDYYYLQVGKQVYFEGSLLDLDPDNIQFFKVNYSKDNNKVYYKDQQLVDADATSFGLKGLYDDKVGDKNGIFEEGKRLHK